MKPLDNRRQAAQLAALDALNDATKYTHTVDRAVEGAIEAATRVQVTREIEDAFFGELPQHPRAGDIQRALRATFEAAGFEVVP